MADILQITFLNAFWNEKFGILIQFSQMFVSQGPLNNKLSLV